MSVLTINELYELSDRVENIAIKLALKGRNAVIDDIMKLVYELRDEADMLDRDMENEYFKLEEQEYDNL
jgi:hypothetical protein